MPESENTEMLQHVEVVRTTNGPTQFALKFTRFDGGSFGVPVTEANIQGLIDQLSRALET